MHTDSEDPPPVYCATDAPNTADDCVKLLHLNQAAISFSGPGKETVKSYMNSQQLLVIIELMAQCIKLCLFLKHKAIKSSRPSISESLWVILPLSQQSSRFAREVRFNTVRRKAYGSGVTKKGLVGAAGRVGSKP